METVVQKDAGSLDNEQATVYTEATDDTAVTEGGKVETPETVSDDRSSGESAEVENLETMPENDDDGGEAALDELEEISGKRYGCISEFPGYRRYLELRKSGLLSAREAYLVVNRGNTAVNSCGTSNISDTKRHLSASQGKRSSGEVFTREDREELAKWGISATGDQLERLWREAGR